MVVTNLVIHDIVRRKHASQNEEYAIFLNSVYNESALFDVLLCNDLHTSGFKYTFFLS